MTTRRIEGKCLCGAVTVRMTPPEPHVDACHCGMCRRWGGGPFLSLKMVTDPEIEGQEHIARYASSDWAERAFCRQCGTHLFYYYKPEGGYSFAAGLFDAANGFALPRRSSSTTSPTITISPASANASPGGR